MHDQQILPDATNLITHLRIGNVRGEERLGPRKRPPSAPEIPRYQGPASGVFAVMGLFKQFMIFGKTGLQGLPTRVTLFLWAFSRQGATGVPLFTTWDSVVGLGATMATP